jgi:hypothetical protein
MMPSPKWKLIVDLGVSAHDEVDNSCQNAQLATELLNKLSGVIPRDQRSPLAEYLPGFSSIRLLLTTTAQSDRERALFNSVIECYRSYKSAGVSDHDAAWMTARDCMLPSKHMQISQLQPPQEVMYGAASSIQSRQVSFGQATAGYTSPRGPSAISAASLNLLGYENAGQEFGLSVENLYNFSPRNTLASLNNQVDEFASFASFGLDQSQISALLQSDSTHFPGLR